MPLRRLLLPALAVLLAATACAGAGTGGGSDGRPLVVASFYPLAFAARSVAGEHARVEDLTPPGVEPHDLELSPGQVRLLHDADLVLYLGEDFQPALEDVVEGLDAMSVDVLAGMEILGGQGAPDDDENGGDDHGDHDPHVWLDPRRMQDIVGATQGRLAALDPDNAAAYERNAAATIQALDDLDGDMQRGLQRCDSRDLVVSHEAFGYLAARYDLDQVGIAGLDPEAEPSPQRLAEAIRFARANDVRTIFFESLVSPAVAETVAREVGAATAVLDPLESAPGSGDYLDAMRANLDALRSGLGCA